MGSKALHDKPKDNHYCEWLISCYQEIRSVGKEISVSDIEAYVRLNQIYLYEKVPVFTKAMIVLNICQKQADLERDKKNLDQERNRIKVTQTQGRR